MAEFAAIVLAGAGHGWVSPIYYSAVLFVVYPIVFIRFADTIEGSTRSVKPDMILMIGATLADLFILVRTYRVEHLDFQIAAEAALFWLIAWLILWFLWQVLVVLIIVRKTRRRAEG